ncbi:MAG: hypothetical protein WDO14_09370 [Bacteroidota bacterium]
MKLFVFLLAVPLLGYSQTIRIADNNALRPMGANIYNTIQLAVDAAQPGDIVYVQPSLTSYGDVTITKQITLRGIGFNTGKDQSFNSTLANIGLTNNAANSTNASGTIIEGIAANNIYVGYQTGSFTYTLQNITIRNCSLNYIWRDKGASYMNVQNLNIYSNIANSVVFANSNMTGVSIYGNLIYNNLYFGYSAGSGNPCNCNFGGGGTLTNSTISNNIIGQSAKNGIFNTTSTSVIIANNIFIGGTDITNSRFITGQLLDVVVANNIFYGVTPGFDGSYPYNPGYEERNVFSNNISYGSTNNTLPPVGSGVGNTGANNKVNVDPLFVSAAYAVAYASTMNFNLQSTSPAKNAGSDGTDIGITGGLYPVSAGNITLRPTSMPVIMSLNPAPYVPQGQPVKTDIKAKSY